MSKFAEKFRFGCLLFALALQVCFFLPSTLLAPLYKFFSYFLPSFPPVSLHLLLPSSPPALSPASFVLFPFPFPCSFLLLFLSFLSFVRSFVPSFLLIYYFLPPFLLPFLLSSLSFFPPFLSLIHFLLSFPSSLSYLHPFLSCLSFIHFFPAFPSIQPWHLRPVPSRW